MTSQSFRRDFITKPIFAWARGVLPVMSDTEREALEAGDVWVAKVIEVDDFAPEALSPIYRKPAEVHQFLQELGEQRAAS
jgi:acyl-CoA dehydrogenase